MKHERHKIIGYPLRESEMFAIVLYCNSHSSNYNLCLSQRDGTYKHKWKVFDWILNVAIYHLSQFEIHNEFIYTGLCGVFLDVKNMYLSRYPLIQFKTNVSFTRDLDVAKKFRGSNGIILGMDMKTHVFLTSLHQLHCCDVSWISDHTSESEILVKRGGAVRIAVHMIKYDPQLKQQWVVCGGGAYIQNSNTLFQRLFGLEVKSPMTSM